MCIKTVLDIIASLEDAAMSMLKHLDDKDNPIEQWYIQGYHDALMLHASQLQDDIDKELGLIGD